MNTKIIVKKRNMTKKEIIWRYIMIEFRQNKKVIFHQKDIAEKFGFSLSTVFNALKIPRSSGIINVTGRNFVLRDYRKFLYLWASHRRLNKDIFYRARINIGISEAESLMPPDIIYGLFSAFKFQYGDTPAEYDHLYIYADESRLTEICKHVNNPETNASNPNFFIIKKDKWLAEYNNKTAVFEQTFADIWNASEWYSKDFIAKLNEKLLA